MNKKGSVEASLLLIIKVVIAMSILMLLIYIMHQTFGIGFSFG